MSEKNVGNPISNRSKQQMEKALLELMAVYDFPEITIQEIAFHAGLSRRTFYRNYSSKQEILDGCFFRIWNEYRENVIHEPDLSIPNIARVFFSCMKNHLDFLTLMNRHQLLSLYLVKVDELLPSAFYAARGRNIQLSDEAVRYALAFSAGGFIRITILWLNDGAKKTPDEMARMMEGYFLLGQGL